MNGQPILIRLLKKQIMNDVALECSIVGRTLQRNPETISQGGDIMNVNSDLTKPILARAITEGFGEVKRICQRYLILGRDVDDNRLERIDEKYHYSETLSANRGSYNLLAGTLYCITVEADKPVTLLSSDGAVIGTIPNKGSLEYIPETTGCIKTRTEADKVKIVYAYGEYGTLELNLDMPCSFNAGMTETAKSCAHRMIVDHAMHALLLNEWPEKSMLYKERFNADADGLRNALQARTRFGRHAADWS